jgi:hypothetical protein
MTTTTIRYIDTPIGRMVERFRYVVAVDPKIAVHLAAPVVSFSDLTERISSDSFDTEEDAVEAFAASQWAEHHQCRIVAQWERQETN